MSHLSFHSLMGYVNWLHDFVASSASLVEQCFGKGETPQVFSNSSLPAVLSWHQSSLTVIPLSPLVSHKHTRPIGRQAGDRAGSSGCQAICLTWLLKSMTVCGAQVWSEMEEVINLKWSVFVYVCARAYVSVCVCASSLYVLSNIYSPGKWFLCVLTLGNICQCLYLCVHSRLFWIVFHICRFVYKERERIKKYVGRAKAA